MERQDLQETIDLYLSGQLPEAERLAFETAMSTNTQLQQQVEEQAHLRGIIRSYGAHQLKKRLQKIEKESVPTTRNPYWWLYLIIGLLLAGLAYWLIQSEEETQSPQQLYAAYYQPFQPLGLNTRDQEEESWGSRFLQVYQQKDYTTALQLFDQQPGTLSDNPQYTLMAAIANLETEQKAAAKQLFQQVTAATDPYFSDEAYWYLGLLALQEGNAEQAKSYLQKVADDNQSEFQKKAKELLKQLP
ncbi:MAG: hypothetical protein KDC24_08050 [Saprospiraceae bacterium]|nr:hypothetical protein [Saprospiraceae bacterium]